MIREFVPRREAHAARRPISIDDVAAGDFRLFAAVLREAGNHERVAVRAEHRTAAFVEPLRRNAHDAGRRFSASQPVSKHADAVGRRVLGLLRVVHRVAVFRASQVRQAGARHQAACRLDGVIDWRQQLPGRVPLIHLVVVDDLARCAMCDELGECSSRVHGRRCQGMRRHRVLEQSKVRFVDERDTPPSPVSELNDAAHHAHLERVRQSPLDNDQGNGLAGERDLQRRAAARDVQARRRTGEPRQLARRLELLVLRRLKALAGDPIRCHAANALLWSASIRKCCSLAFPCFSPRPSSVSVTAAVRAGHVVVVIVPDQDRDRCWRRGWRARRRRACRARRVFIDRVEVDGAVARRRRRAAAHLAEHAEDVQHRQVDAVRWRARGSRRSTAGPRTRTPRSARPRG